ncbi:regulator of G-protein signaling 11 isoform X10 [Camelus bactrianus]|uniref:Regulator of G-protein signaling 11 isoform X10 n=1 Tax=Camelus bactrianus TaxID=9837 RepID=A0AC58NYE2_CAMBA
MAPTRPQTPRPLRVNSRGAGLRPGRSGAGNPTLPASAMAAGPAPLGGHPRAQKPHLSKVGAGGPARRPTPAHFLDLEAGRGRRAVDADAHGAGGSEYAGPRPGREDAEPAPAYHRHSPRSDWQRRRGVVDPKVLHRRGWAAKQRRKGDRLVIACQEQTYWLVNRPPTKTVDFYKREIECCRKALGRTRVKSSVCLEAYLKFSSQRGPHDPLLSGCLPSNPWVTDDDTYWAMNAPRQSSVVRSPPPLLLAPHQRGCCLGTPPEFPPALGVPDLMPGPLAENLSFWEACEELRHGGQAQVPALVDAVYQQFLAPGAARWVNIDSRTMERTLEGLGRPHRHVLDDAQLHIYMLMKKDSYPRFLKSDLYKDLLAEAVVPLETKRRVFPFMWKPRHSSPSLALLPTSTSGEPEAAAGSPGGGDGET